MENSLLSDIFRAQLAKMDYNNKNEAQPDIGYPTGFLNLDYANGYVAQQYDANTGTYSDYFNIGVSDGSFIAIRPSGTEPKCKVYLSTKADSYEKAIAKAEEFKKIVSEVVR